MKTRKSTRRRNTDTLQSLAQRYRIATSTIRKIEKGVRSND